MPARRFRTRELHLADGTKLLVRTDGSIQHVDSDGTTRRTWAPDDPEWPPLAIRFGVRVQPETNAPTGRSVEATKPPLG